MTGWFIALPFISTFTPDDFAFDSETRVRFFGVGTMLVGGIWTLWTIRSAVSKGLKEAISGIFGERVDMSKLPRTDRDIPPHLSMGVAGLLTIPIIGVLWYMSGSLFVAVVAGSVMVVAAYLFSAIAGYIAGIVGSSNNPLSGVTIIVLLFTSLLLYALGARGVVGMTAVIGVGAVVACAASIAGDNLQDLKSGWILGSTPWKLQLALILGVLSGALVIAPVVNVLHEAYVIGEGLQAPQAFLMKAITEGVFHGNMDWIMVLLGGLLAVILIYVTKIRKISFSIMAFAVGIYLPWFMSTPIMFGGVMKYLVDRRINERTRPMPKSYKKADREAFHEEVDTMRDEVHNQGVLCGSGLIAGEAIMGVIMAALVVSGGNIAVIQGAPGWAGFPVFVYMALLIGYVSYRELDNEEFKKRFKRVLRKPPPERPPL